MIDLSEPTGEPIVPPASNLDPSLSIETGIEHHKAGRYQDAESIYRRILRGRPDDPDALQYLGLLLAQRGNTGEATMLFEMALSARPQAAVLRYNLGKAYEGAGRRSDAIRSYRDALERDGEYVEAHLNLGNVLKSSGEIAAAVDCYRRALAIRPELVAAHVNLGLALQGLGRPGEALESFRRALALDPESVEGRYGLACLLLDQGHTESAIEHLERALRRQPDHAEALNNLGCALLDIDRVEEALGCFRRALELRPDDPEPHANSSTAELALGRLGEAEASASRAVELAPDCAKGYFHLATVCRLPPDDPRVARMSAWLEKDCVTAEERTYLSFALGRVYDAAGRYDEAFDRWMEGNRLKRARLAYDARSWQESLLRIERVLNREALAESFGGGDASDLPIFVVGMPRSGTTLVEQILASHPGVHGAGELAVLGRIAGELQREEGYLASPRLPSRRALAEAGRRYAEALRALDRAAARISDKLPENFIHLGLIALCLPKARIVHCRRDPLDTCLSCFSILFAGDNQPFTYDLEDLGSYYRGYERLMAHWRQALPVPMFEVTYEDLVLDPEGITRELLAFCGLPWDQRCLQFERAERPVRTASNLQVRQPLYTQSVGRWRRYESRLEPLRRALDGEGGR